MSGGGGRNWNVSELKADLEKLRSTSDADAYLSKVNELLRDVLRSSNERDSNLINGRLERILRILDKNGDEVLKFNFGGSVAKHTYVDGISDIDVLLAVSGSHLENKTPEALKGYITKRLINVLEDVTDVSVGQLAVTVQYRDDMQIQILPALKEDGRLSIPAAKGNGWSEVNPRGFTSALTKANQRLSGKLVPTIKLVKAINSNLPDGAQLTGYHIESIAIQAFKAYSGELSHKAMLQHYFSSASEIVKSPIRDKTGQSVHVDTYLGARNSADRLTASNLMQRIERRLSSADLLKDSGKWSELFE